jgi:hypothetical protein
MSRSKIILLFTLISFTLIGTSCMVRYFIPATERSFTSDDLILKEEELSEGWELDSGPSSGKMWDNRKPPDSTAITLSKLPKAESYDAGIFVSIYPSIERAKIHYMEDTTFPSNTDVEGWSYISDRANEQKFSCYTYSNSNYPTCRWLARYYEITVQVTSNLRPGRATIGDFQAFVMAMDEKLVRYLDGE